MLHPVRRALAATALFAAAACGRAEPALSDDLQKDLAEAQSAGLELAPRATNATTVVSAVEQIQPGPAPARIRRAPVRRPTPRAVEQPVVVAVERDVEQAPEPAPMADVAVAPPPAEVEMGLPAPRPRPLPTPAPGRRGPYKTTAEVIRDAPFPIHP